MKIIKRSEERLIKIITHANVIFLHVIKKHIQKKNKK